METWLIDVSVVNPTAPSYVMKGGDNIKKRENDKSKEYAVAAEESDATFVPFVCESYGTMGPCSH